MARFLTSLLHAKTQDGIHDVPRETASEKQKSLTERYTFKPSRTRYRKLIAQATTRPQSQRPLTALDICALEVVCLTVATKPDSLIAGMYCQTYRKPISEVKSKAGHHFTVGRGSHANPSPPSS